MKECSMTKKLTITQKELKTVIRNLELDTQFDADWIAKTIWNGINKLITEREIEEEAHKIRARMNC